MRAGHKIPTLIAGLIFPLDPADAPDRRCGKPFVWSKTADDIINRERRALDALDEIRGNRSYD